MGAPKLRFKGFGKDWSAKKLKEFTIRKTKKNTDKKITNVLTNSAANGIIRQNDFFDRDIANQNNLSGYYIVTQDDFVYNPRISNLAPVGPIKRSSQDIGVMSPLYTVFGINDKINISFIEHFFTTDKWHNYLKEIANYGVRSDRMNLSSQGFFSMPIVVPTLLEQQKIADFLTSVDEKINLLKKKKDLLEQYKKGVMQKIFSQELRFKDEEGKNFPEWEEKKIKDVLRIGSGRDYKHLGEGIIPVYGSGGVMTYVDQFLYEGESIGIGRKGTINKPVFLQGKFWTVDTLFYTHSFEKCLPKFIYYTFLTINWLKHNEAGGVPSLSKINIENIFVGIPSISEQEKIADFLTALDDKIALVEQQINKTELWKKGLLQQMFV